MSATQTAVPERDPQLLALLSDEEREALDLKIDGEDDGAPPDDDDQPTETAAAPAEPAAAAKPDGDSQPAAVATEEPAPAAAAEQAAPTAKPQPQPVTFSAVLPADYDAQVKAIADEKTALAARLRDGEIDAAEYQVHLDAVNDRRLALAEAKMKADLARDMSQQSAEAMWKQTVESFIAGNPNDGGIDYAKNRTAAIALDTYVRELGNDPANNDRSMLWFLEEADKRVMADLSFVRQKPAPAPAPAPSPAATKVDAARRPPVAAAPKTLAEVPGSSGPGDPGADGEFSHLDRLSGEALEKAFAGMTPAQRERWMATQ